jgi:predicted phage gp36 major capsid-like protein
MNIREMPWFERPGARLKRSDPEALSDAEMFSGDEMFEEKMKQSTGELRKQMEEGMKPAKEITKNLETLGYGC